MLVSLLRRRHPPLSQLSLLKHCFAAKSSTNMGLGISSIDPSILNEQVRRAIPPMTAERHKGQAGRIGVVGGSLEYTGAPYFAAISAMKLGADLAHVFCMEEAAMVIKSYSPELIVHPLLNNPKAALEIDQWLPRLHALVLGPGLGRDEPILETFAEIVKQCMYRSIPIIIDADGLFYINQHPELIANYSRAILTPNAIEFDRLYQQLMKHELPNKSNADPNIVKQVAAQLGHVTILVKGQVDVISDGKDVVLCKIPGSPRRCGGQGDMLSGILATLLNWTVNVEKPTYRPVNPTLSAAYVACVLAKTASQVAFTQHKRGTLTSQMIEQIPLVFQQLFPDPTP